MICNTDIKELEITTTNTGIDTPYSLTLWNDNHNTFEHVIACLVKFIHKTPAEAESIAWYVHTEGKHLLLEGSKSELIESYNILKLKGLTVSLD